MLFSKLRSDMIMAIKSKDELKLSVIRMAITNITNKQKANKCDVLSDSEIEIILASMIKQRRDSYEQFIKGDRPLLAKQELDEIVIIESYLPKEASLHDIQMYVAQAGLINNPNVGSMIKKVKELALADNLRLNNKIVSEEVKSYLNQVGTL